MEQLSYVGTKQGLMDYLFQKEMEMSYDDGQGRHYDILDEEIYA